jgi:hypothetical protein
MQNESKEHTCAHEAVAELFHVQIDSDKMGQFIERGDLVDDFFSTLDGYAGMDILILSETKLIILIRWDSYTLFDKNLPSILNGCPIASWLKNAVSFSHQPTLLTTFSK